MKTYRSIIGSLMLAAVMGNVLPAAPTLDQLRRQAQGYYREGEYPAAVKLYQRMVALAPRNADVVKEAMWSYWNMQQFELATTTAQEVLRLRSNDQEAQNVLSWAPRAANREKLFEVRDKAVKNYQAGRYDQAAEFYRQLVELDGANVAELKDWLWSLWSAERFDEVKTVADRILKIQPGDPQTTELLAKLPAAIFRKKVANTAAAANEAQERADLNAAVASYQELIRLKPNDPGPVRSLAWAYYKLQRYVEAADVARQLSALAPKEPSSWNVLARMQDACDELEHAIESYQVSLKLDPTQPDVQTQLGKLYVRMRDLNAGIAALETVRASGHAAPSVAPLLAKALFYSEKYAKAADVWAEAAKKDPSHFEFRYFEAQARYYAGQPAGLKLMQELSTTYQDPGATRFLANEASARGDYVTAQGFMEKLVPVVTEDNTELAMGLVTLYQTMGQTDKSLKVLEKIVEVYPQYAKPLVLQASIYRERQQFSKAAKLYSQALTINPNYDVARLGLALTEFEMGHYDNALAEMAILRKADPTNPYLLLREARFLSETGEQAKARQSMTQWVNQNIKEPLLPILLYHGLTPHKNDPRLAATGIYHVEIFEDHIRALHRAGYTPVTCVEVAAWIAGKGSLPAKPVLITFDDGRLDSLHYADPVLEKYDSKATMFAVMANAEGARPIAYASWPQMLSYQKSGRWEIQSHGAEAHTPIAIDPKRQGLFIVNRRWMAERKDYETPEEWRARVFKDLDDARKEIGVKTGQEAVGYAYADGEYGQHQTNYPPAAIENLNMVRQVYQVGFVEDNYGMNVRSHDPVRLARLEPTQNWSGDQLVAYLHDENAQVFIYQELLHQAMWRGRIREAYTWLNRLQDSGVSERVLWGEEARIRYAAGDLQSGYDLASRVLAYSPEHFERMIEQNLAKEGPSWSPGFVYAKDNRDRESFAFDQRFQFARWGAVNAHLKHRWARFFETGYPSVTDNAAGFGVDYKPSLFHSLSLDVMGHALSGPPHNAVAAHSVLESQWTDLFKTRLEASHDIYFTARAIGANIEQSIGGLGLQWEDQKNWLARLRGRYFSLSDGNRRRQGQIHLSKTVDSEDRLRIAYRFTFDDMNNLSAFYYSPQNLRLHEIGPEINLKFGEGIVLAGSYRAGLGKEDLTNNDFVQDAQAELRIRMGTRVWVSPTYWYQKTPTYKQTTVGMFLRYRFGTLENMGVPIKKEEGEDLL